MAQLEFSLHSLDKSGMTKGGNRHTKKPEVDVGLLLKALTEHSPLVADLGPYEHIGRSQSCHPKGLIKVLPLTKGLLQLSGTGEIHSQCLRQALMNLLVAQPSLNQTIYNGAVWCGSRVERLGVILFHMRRLKFGSEMKIAAAHLTGAELQKLQEVVDMISKKPEVEEAPLPLAKREASDDEPQERRTLKKEISDVSLDSKGLPNCFNSPQGNSSSLPKGPAASSLPKGNATAASSTGDAQALEKPSFLRRRPGQNMAENTEESTKEEKQSLQDALGFGKMKKPASKVLKKKANPKKTTKKPAASLPKGKPKGSLAKGTSEGSLAKGTSEGSLPKGTSGAPLSTGKQKRKPWTKLTWVQTKKAPWRAYICGSHKPGALAADCKLILETTQKRSWKYLEVLKEIYTKLQEEHITKEEALQLRTELEASM